MARRSVASLFFGTLLWLLPAAATAQPRAAETPADVLVRVGGPVHVAAGDEVGVLWAVDSDPRIDGRVRGHLVVVGGTARLDGEVSGDVTVIRGRLDLGPTSRVGDVWLIDGELTASSGAVVTGTVTERDRLPLVWAPAWLAWSAATVLVIGAGLVGAALAGRQLGGAAAALAKKPIASLYGSIAVWFGIPIVAVLTMLSVVGIPLGLAILVVLLPALWFIGYLVAGTALGTLLLRRRPRFSDDHPFAAVAVGLLALQLLCAVPRLGGSLVALAGAVGAGALALRSYHGLRGAGAG